VTRWLIPPLIGALLLTGSGFLRALETTTERSAALAESSESAPRSTGRAAAEVAPLPVLADLTTHQAEAFEELARALDLSAQRVFALNDTLAWQAEGIDAMTTALDGLHDPLDCAARNLDKLGRQSHAVPSGIRGVEEILWDIIGSQDKAIRHLRSINRKLAALGLVATASGVEPPPVPAVRPPAPVQPIDAEGGCPGLS
jgi:hypothetical protein